MVILRVAGATLAVALAAYACGKTKFRGAAPNAGDSPTSSDSTAAAPGSTPAVTPNNNTSQPATPNPGAPVSPSPSPSPGPASTPTIGTTPTTASTMPTVGTVACVASSTATQATLMTPTIQNGVPNNFVEYQLSIVDCNGKKKDFSADVISFDLNAFVNNVQAKTAMTYLVHDSANSMTGVMQAIQGSDLFNHTGSAYYHYSTDKALDFATNDSSVTIHIDLTGRELYPFQSATVTNPNEVQTFLSFGTAAPVSVVVGLIGTNNSFGTLP